MTVIEARGLRKTFAVTKKAGRIRRRRVDVHAVDGIDLTVEAGDMLGYIGPNGAGKSTTLKMFTGVLTPSDGHLRVCGLRPVPDRVQLARRIGVVFGQRSQLWWDLPLRDSFALLRHIYRVPAAEHALRLKNYVELLDVGPLLDTPVRQLSLGQRMRSEVTAALLHAPEVLFLDEPTIGLDIVSKEAVRSALAELATSGDVTVVLTTHDLADIERLCKRLVVIDHGRVMHDGTLDQLHNAYGSRRRVIVELDGPYERLDVPHATVDHIEAEGRRQTLSFSPSDTTAAAVIGAVAASAPLRDLQVTEPDIDEVVRRLYTATP
jgi:ABC-2 type transport system ATP-binding protein